MAIDKINQHYSFENTPTIYDEEALTALELAGRTAAKVNECVAACNDIPNKIASDVNAHIANGDFDKQIDKSLGNLADRTEAAYQEIVAQNEAFAAELTRENNQAYATIVNQTNGRLSGLEGRVDSILAENIVPDDEIADARTGWNGTTYATIGNAIRGQFGRLFRKSLTDGIYLSGKELISVEYTTSGAIKIHFPSQLVVQMENVPYTIIWENQVRRLGDAITYEGNAATITLPVASYLVLNDDWGLYIRASASAISTSDIVLLYNTNNFPCYGLLMNDIHNSRESRLENQVQGFMYVGEKGGVQIVGTTDTGGLTVHLDSSLMYVPATGSVRDLYKWEDIGSEISQYIVKDVSGYGATITVPNNGEILVYNTRTKKLAIRQRCKMDCADIVLIALAWGCMVAGVIYESWVMTQANAGPQKTTTPVDNGVVKRHAAYLNDGEKCDSFLYFTDPHYNSDNEQLRDFFAHIKDCYNKGTFDFLMCGGDWLNSGDTPESACFKLGHIRAQMDAITPDAHLVMGNHDTNALGKLTEDAEMYTGTLSKPTLKNLWYRKHGNTYYKFKSGYTQWYIFDTGTGYDATPTMHQIEQLQWFGESLMTNTAENIALSLHMHIVDTGTPVLAFTQLVLDMADAYNRREVWTSGNLSYDFRAAVGKIRFALFGHAHLDALRYSATMPLIVTTNCSNAPAYGKYNYELCVIDYTNNKLRLVRMGNGEDRTIDI